MVEHGILVIHPELSCIKIAILFSLHKNTFPGARGWGDIWRSKQVSPSASMGAAPTFPIMGALVIAVMWSKEGKL